MNFMEKLLNVLNDIMVYTENGAAGHATTGKALVDLNFSVASLRNASDDEIVRKFIPAFHEDRVLAMKWLFFLRDVRGGLGERRAFRVIMKYLATGYTDMVGRMVEIMAEYGRFDDLLCLMGTPVEDKVLSYLAAQLKRDVENMLNKEGISLCAKWMPSINTSSEESRAVAVKLKNYMRLTAKEYRKMLSGLREYLGVIEVAMSGNCWEEINYSAVPSKANVLYRNAFLNHDKERREAFLADVADNKVSMNAGVLMPHDIVARYVTRTGWRLNVNALDMSLEMLWKNLSDTVDGAENVLCVVDGSGSMTCSVGNGNLTALHVSNAIGIYFAERLKGAYKNKYITFSATPKYVDLSKCVTLREKLELALAHNDYTNTNIEATFDLVLATAVKNRLSQAELPQTILVISDMEFDQATSGNANETLFATIARKYAAYGYKLPKLVFWNVNSRTGVIPVRENELGVGLVSGFSVNVCNMVLSNELDPYKALKKVLNGPRYEAVEKLVG